jgi:hypothetical protein
VAYVFAIAVQSRCDTVGLLTVLRELDPIIAQANSEENSVAALDDGVLQYVVHSVVEPAMKRLVSEEQREQCMAQLSRWDLN